MTIYIRVFECSIEVVFDLFATDLPFKMNKVNLNGQSRPSAAKAKLPRNDNGFTKRITKESIDVRSTCQHQLTCHKFIDFDYIKTTIQRSVLQHVNTFMPTYSSENVGEFTKKVCNDIKCCIKKRECDRYRALVVTNVMEIAGQGINWHVGTLSDSNIDGWSSFQHETSTYNVTVFVALIYWD